jgi:adenosylcobinamide-GDP ribazoletransferase
MTAPRASWRAFLFAGRLLTRWPLPDPGMPAAADLAPEMGRAALFYPLIGLLLGASLAVVALLLADASLLVAAALLLILWVWSTGALHLDGLADCADAWVGGLGSRERTLAILQDPRSGAMAVVALVLVLIAKFAAVAALLEQGVAPLLLLGLPALARAQLLALALTTPYARADGMGAAMRSHLPRPAGWLVLLLAWLLGLVLMVHGFGLMGLAMLLPALLLFWRWRESLLQRLGGYTGDGAGALVELTEVALLLGAALLGPVAVG